MAVGLSIDGATSVVCAQHRVPGQEAGRGRSKASKAMGMRGSEQVLQVSKRREGEVAPA